MMFKNIPSAPAHPAEMPDSEPIATPEPCVWELGKRVWWHDVLGRRIMTGVCARHPDVPCELVKWEWSADGQFDHFLPNSMRDNPHQALIDAEQWRLDEHKRLGAIVFVLPEVGG